MKIHTTLLLALAVGVAPVAVVAGIATPKAVAEDSAGEDATMEDAATATDGADAEDTDEDSTFDAAAFDADAGEKLYMKECRACHGPTAKGVSSYPKLVDKTGDHLVEMLERYRSGEKIGPNTMLMAPRARKLSDEDIGNVVAFITSIEE